MLIGWRLILPTLVLMGLPFMAMAENGVFDARAANKTLDKLSIELSTQQFDVEKIKSAITVLVELREEAQDCIDENEQELGVINKSLELVSPAEIDSKKISPEQKYLLDKKSQLDKELSACRLFELRSSESIDAFNKSVQQHVASELFKKEPTAWFNLIESIRYFPKIGTLFNWERNIKNSGYHLLNSASLLIAGFFLLICFAVAMALRHYIQKFLPQESQETFSGKAKQSFMAVMASNIVPLICLFFISAYITWVSYGLEPAPYLITLSYALLAFVLFRIVAQFFFYPPKPAEGVRDLPRPLAKVLYQRLYLLALLLLFGYFCYIVMQGQEIPDAIWFVFRAVFITLISVILISVIWLVIKTPKLLYYFRAIRGMVSLLLSAGLVCILVTEWLGYHQLAEFILFSVAETLILILFAWLAYKLLIAALDSMNNATYRWQQRVHNELGLRRRDPIPELVWLRIVVLLVVWGGLVILLGAQRAKSNRIQNY